MALTPKRWNRRSGRLLQQKGVELGVYDLCVAEEASTFLGGRRAVSVYSGRAVRVLGSATSLASSSPVDESECVDADLTL